MPKCKGVANSEITGVASISKYISNIKSIINLVALILMRWLKIDVGSGQERSYLKKLALYKEYRLYIDYYYYYLGGRADSNC